MNTEITKFSSMEDIHNNDGDKFLEWLRTLGCIDLVTNHRLPIGLFRYRAVFQNNFSVSFINGYGTYSNGTSVEVSVKDPNGNFCPELLPSYDEEMPDDVEGYVSIQKLCEIFLTVSQQKGTALESGKQ